MDTPRVLLEHYLKQLRLPTMVREFPKLAEQCAKEGATFEQFLLRLVEQEMLDRERRATERRIKAAKFPVLKSLETYDFLAIPSLNKKLVVELARCEWIGRRDNVLALGNSGTGKTHIGLALGLAACQQGFRVRFTTAASLVPRRFPASKLTSQQAIRGRILTTGGGPMTNWRWSRGSTVRRKQSGCSGGPRRRPRYVRRGN